MEANNNISQASAEMLLNYLYPELSRKWIARYVGTFYRNYNNDSMSIYEDTNEVILARDGFLKLLPEALISDENELKGGNFQEKYKKVEQKKKFFEEVFLPFNTFSFRENLYIEKNISNLLYTKLDYVLKTYFNYDRAAETNPYVKRISVILPYVSELRANFSRIAKLLGVLMGCKTKMKVNRYSDEDSTRCWVPNVEYQLLIPGLTAEEYRKLKNDVVPLQQFISEWLMPVEVRCEITIKHHNQPQNAGEGLILDYNTEFVEN